MLWLLVTFWHSITCRNIYLYYMLRRIQCLAVFIMSRPSTNPKAEQPFLRLPLRFTTSGTLNVLPAVTRDGLTWWLLADAFYLHALSPNLHPVLIPISCWSQPPALHPVLVPTSCWSPPPTPNPAPPRPVLWTVMAPMLYVSLLHRLSNRSALDLELFFSQDWTCTKNLRNCNTTYTQFTHLDVWPLDKHH